MTKERDINPEEELLSSSESIDRKLNDRALEDFEQDLVDTTSKTDQPDQEKQAKTGDGDENIEQEMGNLIDELKEAKDKAEQHWDQFVRAKAELENLRRRAQRDVENAHKYASEKFIQAILPVIDSLEMGAAAARQDDATKDKLLEGMELTVKMFTDILEKFEIEKMDPVGEQFNPEFHQAMSMQESDKEKPNTVLAVMQKGYKLKDRLIRPAMVVVAKAKDKSTNDQGPSENIGTNIDEKA